MSVSTQTSFQNSDPTSTANGIPSPWHVLKLANLLPACRCKPNRELTSYQHADSVAHVVEVTFPLPTGTNGTNTTQACKPQKVMQVTTVPSTWLT
ncbi:unnamed protein product [Dibothriocephalus latus]|uniref:Uncharacterized protein n=1 Tax=Dibothriocephalus latus TaxID=60516 RepID=A0A3P7NY37_DIBLA|nr:unnamed protein product [Dibothriocephalus latus]